MWTLDASAEVPLWRPADRDPEVVLAFSTRRGGVSAAPYDSLNLGRSTGDRAEDVTKNRRRLLHALALDHDRLATAGQMHGVRVVAVEAPGHTPACDALLTRRPGVPLAVSTADCMSLLFHATGTVAAAHAGWRGTADGIPRATLLALCAAAGVAPQRVTVHLGPCIRACCYEVGDDVARRFPAAAVRRAGAAWHLDLPHAARLQLLEAGLPPDSLHDSGACTACDASWYYSHRRDRERTGRHWGIVALRA